MQGGKGRAVDELKSGTVESDWAAVSAVVARVDSSVPAAGKGGDEVVDVVDVVMKGTSRVRFGVPEVALGGQVIGVGAEGLHDNDEGLYDVPEEKWNESASVGVQADELEERWPATPGGVHLGGAAWMMKALGEIATDELCEFDFRVIEEARWEMILMGEGVVPRLCAEILIVLLEEEGYDVDVAREKKLAAVAVEQAAVWWEQRHGLEMWQEVCANYRELMVTREDEADEEVLAVLEAQQAAVVELEAERQMDLSMEDGVSML
jgi:hypothetical protein